MGIPLLWNNWLLPVLGLGLRGRTAANAVFATAYAAGFGTRRSHCGSESLSRTRDYVSNLGGCHVGEQCGVVPNAEKCTDRESGGSCHVPNRRACRDAAASPRVQDPVDGRRTRDAASARRGLCWGTALFTAVALGYAAAVAIPSTRIRLTVFAARAPEVDLAEWAVIHIPIGTVYSEELIFRVTLDPFLDEYLGRHGIWIGAMTFGLWHITPARAAGDNVAGTIVTTTLAGLGLGWLRRRTGSVLAPALLHIALNAGGAIAPRIARRIDARP